MNPTDPSGNGALAELRALIGDDSVLTDETVTAPYLVDQLRLYRGRTLAVVLPRSTEEVSKLVGWCHEHRVGVVPQGGNTGYCGGATPDSSGNQLVLALGRMNRIRAIDAPNFSITVEAGCVLARVQQAADEAGRFFPLSLGSEGSCQIGGNLATNAGGVNVLRFGMARDLLLGLEAVLPDGRVYHGLNGLRKDNTGYHLGSLLVGSEGTLAVITAATLKLWPQMRSTATAFVAVSSVNAVIELLALLRTEAGERLSSLEYIPRSALRLAFEQIPDLQDPLETIYDNYLLVELSSAAIEPLDELLQSALEVASERGLVVDAALASSVRQRLAFWKLREAIPQSQRNGPSLKHDVSVPITTLPTFIDQVTAWISANVPDGELICYGHAGDGNLHCNISMRRDGDPATFKAREPQIKRVIHDMVRDMHGSISAEHGIGQAKIGEFGRYAEPLKIEMMRTLKQALDPRGIMNPGKLFAR
jgi:FAD/FMN-containing dehydrogenase